MLKRFVQKIGGDPNRKAIEAYSYLVELINDLEPQFEKLTNEELSAKTEEFRTRLNQGDTLDDFLPEAFAVVREASKRTIGLRHYDVQLIGGVILHQGKVVEMRTGEGKTLVATLPLYLNALSGKGAHLVTVNDYLARRDARWMAPIYDLLGLSVGVLQMGSRTESGKKAFLVDLKKESQQEDQHQLVMVDRVEAYQADITYGTNNEFGFDYLRDNMRMRLEDRSQREHHYAIIDEVDNVLIDEARTPLIISGPSHDDAENYIQMARVVKQLRAEDYEINEKDRTATLTEIGETHVEQILGIALRAPDRPEDITPEQARLLGFLEQAMRAQYLFKRNKDYLVQGGQVIIVDEFTGRLMPGRRWSDGLHQAVEAKEGANVQSENITHATITIQNYFRMYEKLAGMTGTALTEAEEFDNIYKLEVIALPSNIEYNASREDANYHILKDTDQYGYEYTFYALKEDPDNTPIFWKRKDYPDVVYRTVEAKLRAIVKEITAYNCIGRPILVGTTSVENSERLSNRLRTESVRKLMQTLLIRRVWMDKNNRVEDMRLVMPLAYLYEPLEKVEISQMRQMARELGITLNIEDESNLDILADTLLLDSKYKDRLLEVIKKGIPHQVLNARRHTEESQIIAGAGAFGAVTIATNMAGRGVDIKLGGELAEEILTAVNRVLRRSGIDDPFEMTLEERLGVLNTLSSEDFGIYSSEVNFFIQSMRDMASVKELGGLHVIGSERHEARRIDNQLRGRAARQGDPGSSRFYLSMEDDLMRLFGGEQMDSMMQRLGMDDAIPLELKLVSRIIEQSQTRVEGANFDTRKHLLEYDDVLNSQRASIYAQRDHIFTKENLNEDILDMLQTEIKRRVPAAMDDPEGPWKLLGWLEQIQPSMMVTNEVFPSFTFKLLLNSIREKSPASADDVLSILLDIVRESINSEEEHVLNGAITSLELIQKRLAEQIKERIELLDTFIEGLVYADETDTRSTKELMDELTGFVRNPVSLSSSEQQLLRNDPYQLTDIIGDQVKNFLVIQSITRLIGSVERRLLESLQLIPKDLAKNDWEAIEEQILGAIKSLYEKRRMRYIGENGDGLLTKQIQSQLEGSNGKIDDHRLLRILIGMTQEERMAFDKRTHRQITVRTSRFSPTYYAAHLLDNQSKGEISENILTHLLDAQKEMVRIWGMNVWDRVSQSCVKDLPEKAQQGIIEVIDQTEKANTKDRKLDSFNENEKKAVVTELGRLELTEVYRQLILGVISELWVEYLTQMEALRISIGLEAYAQRDPLVMYKTRASEMYKQLFDDMRLGVVTRMFTFRPRQLVTAQVSQAQPRSDQTQPDTEDTPAQTRGQAQSKSKRKRRHKRKKK
jgi:preprotein translocase subunit SecA